MNKIVFLLLMCSMSLIQGVILVMYPNVQGVQIFGCSYVGKSLILRGQLSMYFTDSMGIYPNVTNEFLYFNEYWQRQVGKSYQGFKLVAIEWTLLRHTSDHDVLGFTVAVQ